MIGRSGSDSAVSGHSPQSLPLSENRSTFVIQSSLHEVKLGILLSVRGLTISAPQESALPRFIPIESIVNSGIHANHRSIQNEFIKNPVVDLYTELLIVAR